MTLAKLSAIFREADIENHVKQKEVDGGATFTISTFDDGDWTDAGVAKTSLGKLFKVKVKNVSQRSLRVSLRCEIFSVGIPVWSASFTVFSGKRPFQFHAGKDLLGSRFLVKPDLS